MIDKQFIVDDINDFFYHSKSQYIYFDRAECKTILDSIQKAYKYENIIIKGRNRITKEEKEKEIFFAEMAVKNVETPMLMYEEEKAVVKKALSEYISKLESELRDN